MSIDRLIHMNRNIPAVSLFFECLCILADEFSWQETCEHFSELLSGIPFDIESCISLKSKISPLLHTQYLLQTIQNTSTAITKHSVTYLYKFKTFILKPPCNVQ
jgi:hypothetical protein